MEVQRQLRGTFYVLPLIERALGLTRKYNTISIYSLQQHQWQRKKKSFLTSTWCKVGFPDDGKPEMNIFYLTGNSQKFLRFKSFRQFASAATTKGSAHLLGQT